MTHVVDIFAPPTNLGSRGQAQGAPTLVMENVPCKIVTLSGREAEIARQLLPTATLRVEMFGPIPGLEARCFFKQHPVTTDSKKIHVGHVDDIERNGFQLHCLCEEEE